MSKPKTVKVRVAVAVDPNGIAAALIIEPGEALPWGFLSDMLSDDGEARYILTAELEIPKPREVAAEVEKP